MGAGTLTFYWKVSSKKNSDWLEFYIDDVRQDRISGISTSWQQKSYSVTGEGKHTFKWRYIKDGSDDDGNDRGYVDYLQWTGDAAPAVKTSLSTSIGPRTAFLIQGSGFGAASGSVSRGPNPRSPVL
ncbi:MAG: hypothetical protein ACYTAS_17480 [Planctomycetota bacterium]